MASTEAPDSTTANASGSQVPAAATIQEFTSDFNILTDLQMLFLSKHGNNYAASAYLQAWQKGEAPHVSILRMLNLLWREVNGEHVGQVTAVTQEAVAKALLPAKPSFTPVEKATDEKELCLAIDAFQLQWKNYITAITRAQNLKELKRDE